MPEKKTVSAREVIADIRVGMTDAQLMAKHQLSVKGLQSLKNKLLAAGLLTKAELDGKTSPGKVVTPPPVDKKAFARNIAVAVKAGLSDDEIMKKFGISAAKLPGVLASLVKAGYLVQDYLDYRPGGLKQTVELGAENVDSVPKTDLAQTASTLPPESTKDVLKDFAQRFNVPREDLERLKTASIKDIKAFLDKHNIPWSDGVELAKALGLQAGEFLSEATDRIMKGAVSLLSAAKDKIESRKGVAPKVIGQLKSSGQEGAPPSDETIDIAPAPPAHEIRASVQDNEDVLADVAATLSRGAGQVIGRLMITPHAVNFESHATLSTRWEGEVLHIPFTEVAGVERRKTLGLIPNVLWVRTRGGEEYKFAVHFKIVEKLVALTQRAAKGETIPNEDRVISATVAKQMEYVKYAVMAVSAVVALYVIIKLTGLLGIWGDNYADRVRNGHFEAFGNEVTVGEALKSIGGNVKWSSSSLASNHPEAKTHLLVEAKWKNPQGETVVAQFIVPRKGDEFYLHGVGKEGQAKVISGPLAASILEKLYIENLSGLRK